MNVLFLESFSLATSPKWIEEPSGFQRYECSDSFDRKIIYYLSKNQPTKKLPLVHVILGSGGQSVWLRRDGNILGGIQSLVLSERPENIRVLIVEKPGVEFCFQPPRPGSAIGYSKEFLAEHSLPRWTEANVAAVKHAWTLPNVDPTRTLSVGHSEGGIVAAKVAAHLPTITHLGLLASGGPNQLFDLSLLAEKQAIGEAASIRAEWANIQKDPESTSKFAWGHPYLRWSSFLASSTLAETLKSKAKVYAATGTLDSSVPVESFDVLRAELTALGRDSVFERIEGADHGFRKVSDPPGPPLGFQAVIKNIVDWFLKP